MPNALPRTAATRWLYALKPMSWPKLFVPTLVGQAIGAVEATSFSVAALAVGLAFTALDTCAIVLLNDWGDRDVDAIKRARFPDGCSPKTIPDAILGARSVLAGGIASVVALLAFALACGPRLERPALGSFALGAAALFGAYTFRPLALNYRGGGELIEALGVGVVLPTAQAYLQSGELFSPSMRVLSPALFALALSSALASGLSDEESDREGKKSTFTTRFGNGPVRRAVELCLALGALLLACAAALLPRMLSPCALLAALVVAAHLPKLRRQSPAATTNAFAAQGAYKATLHSALWRSQWAFAAACLVALAAYGPRERDSSRTSEGGDARAERGAPTHE